MIICYPTSSNILHCGALFLQVGNPFSLQASSINIEYNLCINFLWSSTLNPTSEDNYHEYQHYHEYQRSNFNTPHTADVIHVCTAVVDFGYNKLIGIREITSKLCYQGCKNNTTQRYCQLLGLEIYFVIFFFFFLHVYCAEPPGSILAHLW